jgi:hypothetical protein
VEVWPQFDEQGVIEVFVLLLRGSLGDDTLIDGQGVAESCEVKDVIAG